MIVAWFIILVVLLGVSALYGGRNCKAPNSGPFERLLAGRKFVPSKSWRQAGCVEVSSNGRPFAVPLHAGHSAVELH